MSFYQDKAHVKKLAIRVLNELSKRDEINPEEIINRNTPSGMVEHKYMGIPAGELRVTDVRWELFALIHDLAIDLGVHVDPPEKERSDYLFYFPEVFPAVTIRALNKVDAKKRACAWYESNKELPPFSVKRLPRGTRISKMT